MHLGIDVAKSKLDAVLLLPDTKPAHTTVPNSPEGLQKLAAWLDDRRKGATVHTCLEATGTYGEQTARFFANQGHTVSVVNPAAIHAFGRCQLTRSKTDRIDATLIARFCQMHCPPAWMPPTEEVAELQALVRRVETLEQMCRMESNRLDAFSPEAATMAARSSVERTLAFLKAERDSVQQQLRLHIRQNTDLKVRRDLLVSIPGISDTTAEKLLAELPEVSRFNSARQAAAFAGLVPRQFESGSSVRGRPRLSKFGSSRLRQSLFFPAMVALRFNPAIKAMGERLAANGKRKMQILGAAMRKLLHIAYGVLKSGKPFDAAWAGTTVTATA